MNKEDRGNRGYLGERFECRRVRGSEDILYKSTIQIYYTNTCKTPLHICKNTSTNLSFLFLLCTFTELPFTEPYLPIHSIYSCSWLLFSLFRFSLNNALSYSMAYSFPIFLHRFPYFLANLLIFNCLCINDFFAILIGVF